MPNLSEAQQSTIDEIVTLLASKGFSLEEAEQVAWGAKDRIAAFTIAPALAQAKRPLAECVNANVNKP